MGLGQARRNAGAKPPAVQSLENDMEKIADLRKKRAAAYDQFKALADKDVLTPEEQTDYDVKMKAVQDLDAKIKRAGEAQELEAAGAQPVKDQEAAHGKLYARPEDDPYVSDSAAEALGLGKSKGLIIGGAMKMIGKARGSLRDARSEAAEIYGENHPITKALMVSVGASGGFMVPPDYLPVIIELLRARAVVRAAGPRTLPMPSGTMNLPGQASAATAGYGPEGSDAAASEQTLDEIVASYKTLTALVPVSNDMMRYADPSVDAFVRDDLVKVMGLREDLAFLLGDGTQSTPRGYLSFANGYATSKGGVAGKWTNGANATAATKGNFITSTSTFTLATVAAELGGLVNKLDTADVPDIRRVWFMHPRSFNYLYNVQNSLGVYVYRDELNKGTLLGYPFKKSTQIPIDLWNADGSQKDCSFLMLAEMDETLLLDSMTLELAVSTEGSYKDSNGNMVSAFQRRQTLIRAVAQHDFQMRHDASVAIDQFVRWTPAIS